MKHFWIILSVAFLALIPFALLWVNASTTETYQDPTVEQDRLVIHDTIGLESATLGSAGECGETLTDPQTGQVAVGCDSGRSFVTDDFVTGVKEKAVALGEDANCTRKLTTDSKILRKNIEENSADISLEDMEVSYIKTQSGWEVSDIRCLE